ncbi:MAG: RNA polymerase sigma factor [Oscillospiraceae bacterium]|nr:RNA polymerase sigma factor [Oscillospiraceae bacterium]
MTTLLRSDSYEVCEVNEIYQRQVDVIYRVCLSYAKNKSDAEDCVSETFVKLIKAKPQFNDHEHERAWLIRTATNTCKNLLKHWSRKSLNIDDCEDSLPTYDDLQQNTEKSDILDAVRNLPENLRVPVYLYYYEGYKSAEIAEILDKPHSTVRGYLSRARELLRTTLTDYNTKHRKEESYEPH